MPRAAWRRRFAPAWSPVSTKSGSHPHGTRRRRSDHIAGTDLVLCCGGDGTVLRAARAVIPHPVILLGINLGRVGFLTEIAPAQLFEQLDAIVDGAGRIETRAMIETETVRAGEEMREHFNALNDVVIGRRGHRPDGAVRRPHGPYDDRQLSRGRRHRRDGDGQHRRTH